MLLGLIAGDSLAAHLTAVYIYRWRIHAAANLQAAFDAASPGTWQVFLILLNIILAIAFATAGLYTLRRGISRIDEGFRTGIAVMLGVFVALVVNALLPQLGSDSLPIDQTVMVVSGAA